MSDVEIIKWIVMAMLGGFVWFMKRTIDSAETRIQSLELNQQKIKEDYLHKSDFKEFKIELRSMFEEIRSDIREYTKKQ